MTAHVAFRDVWRYAFLAIGVYTIGKGLFAEKFTFRSLGWLPGMEKEQNKPEWYDRLLMIAIGIGMTVFSFWSIVAQSKR